MKPLRIAILNDNAGSVSMTPEDEAEEVIKSFEGFGIPVQMVLHDTRLTKQFQEENPDILVFDYGGAVVDQYQFPEWILRFITKWAEDNPSKVLLIWSSFTAQYVKPEIESSFPNLNNIVYRYSGFNNGVWWDDKIKKWFGLCEAVSNPDENQ